MKKAVNNVAAAILSVAGMAIAVPAGIMIFILLMLGSIGAAMVVAAANIHVNTTK